MRTFPSSNPEGLAIELGCIGLWLGLLVLLPSYLPADALTANGIENELIHASANMVDQTKRSRLTTQDYVRDIVNHPAFTGFGALLLPWDDNTPYYNTRLSQVGSLMPYHSQVNPGIVIGALNHLINEASAGKTLFYDFYAQRQKKEDPAKNATGLFFYRGKVGAPFAIVCPGGGFSYVGSLHEGFPLALEISKKG